MSEETTADTKPEHLVVLVHGLLASPNDWKFVQGVLKQQLGRKYLIYASSSNSYFQTLAGIDSAGRRLTREVAQVVKQYPSLRQISLVAHSLGGLFARYAIAGLFSSSGADGGNSLCKISSQRRTIAGLEPVNFVTLATPHLGVRGRKQLPILFGISFLEKIVAPIAPYLVGRTGQQLFLTDGKDSDPPLLLRMSSDCGEGHFISALASFQTRICYANVSYDHLVGWRTSSIRRESELPQSPKKSLDGYKHVVSVSYCPPVQTKGPSFQTETSAKRAAQISPSSKKAVEYYDKMEEEMIQGLQRVGWRKVDVSFHSALWPFLAHNNIYVKQEWLHKEGAGVVKHVADSLKQEEHHMFIMANL